MGDPRRVAQIFPGMGQPAPSADSSPAAIEEATKDFLRYFDATGFDTSHPYLRDFRPDNYQSILGLKDRIASVAGAEKAEEVLIKGFFKQYFGGFLRKPVGEQWIGFESALAVASAFLQFDNGTKYHDAAFNIQQGLYKFFEKNMETCDKYFNAEKCEDMKKNFAKEGAISIHQSDLDKVTDLDRWEKMPGHQLERIWDKTGGKVLRIGQSEHLKGSPELTTRKGAAQTGFYIYDISLNGSKKGTLVLGNPREGARVGLKVNVKGSVSAAEIERDFEEKNLQLQYQGAVAQESADTKVPLGTVAVVGEMKKIDDEANRLDGLIMVFPDGRMKILDKRSFTLADISGKPEDKVIDLSLTANTALDRTRFIGTVRQYKITLISAVLFDPRGDGTNRLKYSRVGLSDTRYIFRFQNGVFGVFNAEGLHVNAGLDVLYGLQKDIGPLEYVVLCDKGMWDTAKLYKKSGGEDSLGTVSADPSNRIIFYSGK